MPAHQPHAAAASHPADLLAGALARDPAGPLLTYYDDASGERTELSAATLANWAAKTANLLVDGVGGAPGDAVAVRLPAHWLTAGILFGVWMCGLVVTDRAAGAAAAFADLPALPEVRSAGEVYAVALRPLGAGFGPGAGLPADAADYAVEVRAYGDRYLGPPADGRAPALDRAGRRLSGAELVTAARAAGLPPGCRLLVTGVDDPLRWLLAPLAAGGSVVVCRNADPTLLAARAAAERVDVTAGANIEGLPRLD